MPLLILFVLLVLLANLQVTSDRATVARYEPGPAVRRVAVTATGGEQTYAGSMSVPDALCAQEEPGELELRAATPTPGVTTLLRPESVTIAALPELADDRAALTRRCGTTPPVLVLDPT